MTSATQLLDQLDALHAAGDALPWQLAKNGPNDEIRCYIADNDDSTTGWAFLPEDAALIVAAVNTLPQLTAALRAVERLTYASDDGTEHEHNGHDHHDGEPECPACWAQGIRNVLLATLSPIGTTS